MTLFFRVETVNNSFLYMSYIMVKCGNFNRFLNLLLTLQFYILREHMLVTYLVIYYENLSLNYKIFSILCIYKMTFIF